MKTREIVTGKYINKSTYVLYKEDGSVFQTIKEHEPFTIGNQLRTWVPVRVPKKNGKGTILICQKYGDSGNVIEEFPLPHGKKGLWALSSGAARNGVFHTYHEPKTKLEKILSATGVNKNVIEKTDKIDVELEVGGQLCGHCTSNWGYWLITDGKKENITEPKRAPDDDSNIWHRGCMVSTYRARVYDATYVIYYSVGTRMNGTVYKRIEKVLLAKGADENKVVEKINTLF